MILFIFLSIIFVALNILDYYMTKNMPVGAVELNPIVKALGILPVKIVVTVLPVVVGYFAGWWVLAIGILFVGGTCIWNYIQNRKVKS